MTKYYRVFCESNPTWSRVVAANTSFEARRIVAAALQRKILEFYARPC